MFALRQMDSSAYHRTGLSTVPDENGDHYWVKFEKQPFDKGGCRHAFKGTMHGEGPREGQTCVVKAPINLYAKEFDSWVPDIAASKKATRFAKKFNTDCVPQLPKGEYIVGEMGIEFLLPLIAQVKHVAHNDESFVRQDSYVAIESFLEGTYRKFNNNYGYEDDPEGVLLAFTHWTHIISGQTLMICDPQGVETPQGYVLTDPAGHSLEQIYGVTDLGVSGMEKVLQSHTCSIHCTALGLSNPLNKAYVPNTMEQVHRTKYVFEPPDRKYVFQLTEEEKLRAKQRTSLMFSRIPNKFERI